LVVTADDFGESPSINAAVIRAHRDGILTTASLMVNGGAVAEAVELARQNPLLGVGLHLTLVCGRSCLDHHRLGGMVDDQSRFSERPILAGMRYFFHQRWHGLLEDEVAVQFARFRATGLMLDHVNGHLHFHLHPIVLRMVMRRRQEWGVRALRLTRDPWGINVRLSSGRYAYRLSHFLVFQALARWVEPRLRANQIVHTDRVFGLLQNGRVDARYVGGLIEDLPPGDSELYAHPSLDDVGGEFEALSAPRMRSMVAQRRIELVRYQDL
jgi:hopanoid biosynthesis associated protein HpnK